MKIAVVIKECAFNSGGAERYASRLLWRMAESKEHDFHLFSHSWEPQLEERVQCHFVPYRRKPNFLKAYSFARNVKKQLTRYHFDLVLGLTQFVPMDIYRTGGGIFADYLEMRFPEKRIQKLKSLLPKSAYMLHLEKKIIRSPRTYFFMANSHMCRDALVNRFKVDPSRIEVIYNGVDRNIFNTVHARKSRKEIRGEMNFSSGQTVLLFVGNGFGRKNLNTVLETAKELGPDLDRFQFVILGNGKIARYRRKASALGVEKAFHFLGAQDDVHKWYHAADALIHPAVYDPCSNACLEALASGLPVLTTKTNGASHWIQNGENGFVVDDPRDAKTFARCAKEFLDPIKSEKMRHEAPNSVASLTDKNHDKALKKLMEKVSIYKRKVEKLPLEPAFYAKS